MLLMYALMVDAQVVNTVELHEEDGEPVLPPQRGSFASSQAMMVGSFT